MIPTGKARRRAKAVLVTAVCLTGLAETVAAQDAPAPSRDALIRAAREIIDAARYCALVTVDSAGRLQARAVDAFAPDSAFVVRIGTNRRTRKVAEIGQDPRVTLYYFDAPSASYVTLQGRARLVADTAETRRYWKPEWEAFYPNREADYVLITVIPARFEVVSVSRGIGGDPRTWRPPAVEMDAGR